MSLIATIVISPIANLPLSVPFIVRGTYSLSDSLAYKDDHGTTAIAINPPVQLGFINWQFINRPLSRGTHQITVLDQTTGTQVVSNSFTVG
jgi:hypothetical protein